MTIETLARGEAAPTWRTEWLFLTLTCATLVTVADAILLERKKGFFSGGFLAVDHLRSVEQSAAFLAASLLADAAVIGVLVAVGARLVRRLQLTRAARWTAIACVGLGPLAFADFISYELHRYLGDAFDVGLMFDLTGRRPEEFLAVASSHLLGPVSLITGGGVCCVGLVWTINRYLPGRRTIAVSVRGSEGLKRTIALFVLGLCSTALLRAGDDVMENGLRRKPSGKILGYLADVASDVDRDGFGAIARLSDPDPFNAAIFPYAVDVPGNAIDEDGVGGDLPSDTTPMAESHSVASRWQRTPNIVLIVLESFRADVVGAQVDGRDVTPTLNDLASQGVASQLAFSHNGYTAQSRHHLFSGTLAAYRNGTSLIDDFKANGYEVAYFSGQDESFGGPAFSIGFDRADVSYDARVEPERRYSTFSTAGSLAVPLDAVRERVEAFLSARRSERPLFLYVNFHDTHFPYHHSGIEPIVSSAAIERGRIAPGRQEELRATYLNTAANVDRAIAGVLAAARRALPSDPSVIVTSDHGESLYDEGFLGHGYALNDVQTRIPFIVCGLPVRVTEPFGQAELRGALRTALSGPPDDAGQPQVVRDDRKQVFQYLGTVRRPREIAFTTTKGRTVYDFSMGEVRVDGSEWQKPAALEPAAQAAFLELVRFWERLVLAAQGDQ
jgi:hypothetical protein